MSRQLERDILKYLEVVCPPAASEFAARTGQIYNAPVSQQIVKRTREEEEEPQQSKKPAQPMKDRFCRVDVKSVKYVAEGLDDNRAFERDYTHIQNRKLVAVRGKDFTKEKQKNKNKIYQVGLEQGVRSIKYPDSD